MNNLENILSLYTNNRLGSLKKKLNSATGCLNNTDLNELKDVTGRIFEEMRLGTSKICLIAPVMEEIVIDNNKTVKECYVNMLGLHAECPMLNLYDVSFFDILYKLLCYNHRIYFNMDKSDINIDKLTGMEASILREFIRQYKQNSFPITKLNIDCILSILKAMKN